MVDKPAKETDSDDTKRDQVLKKLLGTPPKPKASPKKGSKEQK